MDSQTPAPNGPRIADVRREIAWERRVVLLGLVGALWLCLVAMVVLSVMEHTIPVGVYLIGTGCMVALTDRLPPPRMPARGEQAPNGAG